MDTLAAIGAGAPEIPRFDDGMVNIRELIRLMAEALVNEIMDAQADDACARRQPAQRLPRALARHQRGEYCGILGW